MAISFIKGHPPRYIGLSTDDKPGLDSEVLLESEFIETDTKLTYVFTGETWVEKTATFIPTKNYFYNTSSLAWEANSNVVAARLVDEAGAAYGVKHVQNKPRVSAMPYTYDIAEKNLTDHTAWSKIGYHAAIDTTELDMMPWASAAAGYGWKYPWPTGALTMTLVSSSVEDDPVVIGTGAPGTGAWTVTIYYLTTAFVEKTVTVTLNGQAAVAVASDIYRVNNMRIATCGTGGAAAGNLRLATSAPQTYGYISATKTRQRQCVYTVPTLKSLYITDIYFSSAQQAASKYVRYTIRANYDETSDTVLQRGLFMPLKELVMNNTAYSRVLTMPVYLPATTDLAISAISDSVAIGTCGMTGWLEIA